MLDFIFPIPLQNIHLRASIFFCVNKKANNNITEEEEPAEGEGEGEDEEKDAEMVEEGPDAWLGSDRDYTYSEVNQDPDLLHY